MEETGRVKNHLGECSLNVTCPDGECSEILVSNPAMMYLCHVTNEIALKKCLKTWVTSSVCDQNTRLKG